MQSKMRLTACFLFALTLTATAVERGPHVTLHLWNVPAKGSSSPLEIARRRVFDEFCRQHPQIDVRALVPLKIEGPAAEGNEFMAVAGGVAPDVFYLYGRKIGDYREQGFLLPLNRYLERYARAHDRAYTGISAPDKVWELCHDRGRILCVPVLYYSMALLCRTDLFARAGMTGRVPADWDEMYEMARRLTFDPAKEPGADPDKPPQNGLAMLTGLGAGWHYLQYVWSSGGEVVQAYYPRNGGLLPVPPPPVDYSQFQIRLSNQAEYDRHLQQVLDDLRARSIPTDYTMDDLQWRLITDTPIAVRAMHFYRRLVHQPWLRNNDHEFDITPDMMRSGKAVDPLTGDVFDLDDPAVRKRIYHGAADAVQQQSGRGVERVRFAMIIGTIEEVNVFDPTLYTPVPFPSRSGIEPIAFTAGHYLAINAAITPSDEPGRRHLDAIRDAAWRYIEFVTGIEAQRLRVETYVEQGLEEFIRPASLIDAGYGDLLARIPPQRRRLWENLQGASSRVEPYCDGFTHVMTRELGMPLETLVNDPPDPKTGAYRQDLQQLMSQTCRRVNTMILGQMPEHEVRRRSRLGWVIFGVMAAALVIAGRGVVRLAMRARAQFSDTEGVGVGGHPARRRAYAWLLLAPAVGTILIWAYYPLIMGMIMAFQDYRILGGSHYVGLRNFIETLSAPNFRQFVYQTFKYMVLLVGCGFCVPIILALLLTEIPKGKVAFRVIYYLPAVTTGLVTLFLWKGLLFDPASAGVINRALLSLNTLPAAVACAVRFLVIGGLFALAAGLTGQALGPGHAGRYRALAGLAAVALFAALAYYLWQTGPGLWRPFALESQKFLRDPKWAMWWLVIPPIWAGAGPGCLIYLAALKGIPDEQYEAADLDGAGVWQKFWNVTAPNLHALIIINFVGAVIAAFKESSNIFVMTGGGPENRTMTLGLDIWYDAFLYLDFGRATATACILGSILIGFTLNQLRILNRIQFRMGAPIDT